MMNDEHKYYMKDQILVSCVRLALSIDLLKCTANEFACLDLGAIFPRNSAVISSSRLQLVAFLCTPSYAR